MKKEFDFPASYGADKIVLMVRDPRWVYAYWEITENKYNEIRNILGTAIFGPLCFSFIAYAFAACIASASSIACRSIANHINESSITSCAASNPHGIPPHGTIAESSSTAASIINIT